MNFLYKKPRALFFIFAALTAFSIYSLKDISFNCSGAARNDFYSIEFEYFGMDAFQIEKIIAIPLEEKLRELPGIENIKSVCNYSKCMLNVEVAKDATGCTYATVSRCVNSFYESLPGDVQRPSICSSSSDDKALLCVAFDSGHTDISKLEKNLKTKIQRIDGVSQVSVYGVKKKEIRVSCDSEKATRYKILPWNVSKAIQDYSAGGKIFTVKSGDQNKKMLVKNLITSPKDICDIDLKINVSSFSNVEYCPQTPEEVVRVNSKECLILEVKSSSQEKNLLISKGCRKILKELAEPADYKIIYDNGKQQEEMLKKILAAFSQSFLSCLVIVFFMFGSIRLAIITGSFIATTLLFLLGMLSVLKIPLSSSTLSGITISIGLICDAGLFLCDVFFGSRICAEGRLENLSYFSSIQKTAFSSGLEKALPPLVISTLTTVSVLIPLSLLDRLVPGIKNIAFTSALMITISVLVSLVFLPPCLLCLDTRKYLKMYDKIYNYVHKIIQPKINSKTLLLLISLPVLLFFFSGKNLSAKNPSKILCAQIEYNPEKDFVSVDREVLAFTDEISKIPGIDYVQSRSRRGYSELFIVIKNPSKGPDIIKKILSKKGLLSGFLYLPLDEQRKTCTQSFRIAVAGDETAACRRLASEAARLLQKDSFILKRSGQVVLNFKEEENTIIVRPDTFLLKRAGLSSRDFSHFLRWNLYGPVSEKLLYKNDVCDIRLGDSFLAFSGNASLESVKELLLPSDNGEPLPLKALCRIESRKMPSAVYRLNARRTASFTVEVQSKNTDYSFTKIKEILSFIHLPDGYSFIYPEDAGRIKEDYSIIFAGFLFSLIIIFLLVAGFSENPSDSIKVILTIPLSLLLPLFLRFVFASPLRLGDAVAMVFLSGLCVNNALYILNEFRLQKRTGAEMAFKKVSASLFSSSLTTMAGSVPVMFFQSGFSTDLAFFMFWGSLGSLLSSVIFCRLLEQK